MVNSLSRGTALGAVAIGVFLSAAGLLAAPAVQAADNSAADSASGSAATAAPSGELAEVVITARRLNEARSEIETQTGASTYTITSDAIAATPGGDNVQLNQVLLQAPDVVQDSFGQLHVRADHNDLQYRLNGIILPEGISVFSQTLSPRLISSLSLITGALPAEYGLRTAGIIDLTTNSGLLQPGGEVSVYGGSHGTLQPAAEYGGSSGGFSYYVSGDYKVNDLGIESPDGSANPLHDHSTQGHGFAYFEEILDPGNRVSLILGTSDDAFQIPNQRGLQPTLGLDILGQSAFLSDDLNEIAARGGTVRHRQLAALARGSQLADLACRRATPACTSRRTGPAICSTTASPRTRSRTTPPSAGKPMAPTRSSDAHTVRAGFYFQHDSASSDTTSQVLPIDVAGMQTSNVPLTVLDNGPQSQADRERLSAGRMAGSWRR